MPEHDWCIRLIIGIIGAQTAALVALSAAALRFLREWRRVHPESAESPARRTKKPPHPGEE